MGGVCAGLRRGCGGLAGPGAAGDAGAQRAMVQGVLPLSAALVQLAGRGGGCDQRGDRRHREDGRDSAADAAAREARGVLRAAAYGSSGAAGEGAAAAVGFERGAAESDVLDAAE